MKSREKTSRNKRRSVRGAQKKDVPLSAGDWFERLVAVQARLRAPNGCPWDREQTHRTLRTYLIEEAYEVLDALESGDEHKFAEELGDLLLQVVFHAQIAKEEGRFVIADVIREIHDKMVRRHPHVFAGKRARDSKEVLKNWEHIKAQERKQKYVSPADAAQGAPGSLLDGVPHTLPAVMEGLQLTRRAARIGFDWDSAAGVFAKLREESAELQHAQQSGSAVAVEEEVGDLLFAAVNLARFLHVDPEIALKRANTKFSTRFREMERMARESGSELADIPREQMEVLWERAKRNGHAGSGRQPR